MMIAVLFVQEATSPLTGVSSFWELVGYAQGFEYPIGLILLVGLYFIVRAYVRAFFQWRNHRVLSGLDPSTLTRVTLSDAIKQAPQDNPYRQASEKMLQSGPGQVPLDYVLQYIDLSHERYRETDRFISAAVYIVLSLGLLGTLLGIFRLFVDAGRHEVTELVGLGIAVVSTLLALVVRLILWPANLFVQVWMRKRFHALKEWCTVLAIALASKSPGQDGMAPERAADQLVRTEESA